MSEQVGLRADDPYGGRQPTSHERLAGRPWDASYLDDPPPWDIGAPQPAIVRLAGAGAFDGAVLDAGCGTGENALYVAALGREVLGVDVAPSSPPTRRLINEANRKRLLRGEREVVVLREHVGIATEILAVARGTAEHLTPPGDDMIAVLLAYAAWERGDSRSSPSTRS